VEGYKLVNERIRLAFRHSLVCCEAEYVIALGGLEVAGIPVCDKGRCRVDLCQGEFKKVKLEQG
jgi:hypothetical protein